MLIPARPAVGLRRLALRCSFPPRLPRSRPPRRGSLQELSRSAIDGICLQSAYTNARKQKANPEELAKCLNLVAPRPGLEPGTYGLTVFRPGTETHSSEFWKLRNPLNFLDLAAVVCVTVFHQVPAFCVIFHARLHRNYTGIFTAPLYWQGFSGETRRRFSRRPKLACLKSRRWQHGDLRRYGFQSGRLRQSAGNPRRSARTLGCSASRSASRCPQWVSGETTFSSTSAITAWA